MSRNWNTWGATIIWVLSVIGTAFLAWHDLDKKYDLINLRLSMIEARLPVPPIQTVATSGEKNRH